MSENFLLKKAREIISKCQRLTVLTGAGISAESGVPTFRGADGLWRQYKATDLATPEAFDRDPKLVWEFYNWRRELLAKVQPNPAHKALVKLEKRIPSFVLITQNVDGLHQQAGSKNVIELHGNIWWVKCTSCAYLTRDKRVPLPILPFCPKCGALLRPHVVWFGESLNPKILDKAIESISSTQVLLVVGTSAVVQPAASFIWIAKQRGATVIEINLEKTAATEIADISLLGKAGEILPELTKGI